MPAADHPSLGQQSTQHPTLMVDTTGLELQPVSLPLFLILNARSLYNKVSNFKRFLREIAPSCVLVSETWEVVGRIPLEVLLNSTHYKVISFKRGRGKSGGGAAIVYDDTKFSVEEVALGVPEGVEAAWALLTPRQYDHHLQKIRRICVGSIYISPRSKHKLDTIEHLTHTVHSMRAHYNNEVHFCFGGDLNRVNYSEVLESYGALQSVLQVPTRQGVKLEVLITDLHSWYHPPTTLGPLKVDDDKNGKDSDHLKAIFAPKTDNKFKVLRKKKTVTTRPLPETKIPEFCREIQSQSWISIFEEENLDKKVENFHNIITSILNTHFPEKNITISSLDKKWMTPQIKQVLRKMQSEYFSKGKTGRWRKLKSKFRKLKRKSVRAYFSRFVTQIKDTDKHRFYTKVKQIGGLNPTGNGELEIECLNGKTNEECAEEVAKSFASVSNEYQPVDLSRLPAFLPCLPPPQVTQLQVYNKLLKLKNTRSTLPIDLPNRLRKEVSVELSEPLTYIINTSLREQRFPALWKIETVSPVPKTLPCKLLSDVRKIASTSDFNKLYEGILRDWILEDISDKIDPKQYGGQKGTGTEHLLVCLVDRVLQLLDKNTHKSMVIMNGVDWEKAFDRNDPTITAQKFCKLGLRPSLVPIIIDFMTSRKMKVKFNGKLSSLWSLVGGSPQGSLLGQDSYVVSSNDNTEHMEEEDTFKYIDDLNILEIILLASLLEDYNYLEHVPNDIGVHDKFLPPHSFQMQENLNLISRWTQTNLMKINTRKSNYIMFTRTSNQNFQTRLTMNGEKIDRQEYVKILGVWLSEDIGDWGKNTTEVCKKAFTRMGMLSKLKYVGVPIEDLIEIYCLFIRSTAEYCSAVFATSLTCEQERKLTNIEKTALRIILHDNYVCYEAALEMTGLTSLSERRTAHLLSFSRRSARHPVHGPRMFPASENIQEIHDIRNREKFKVNFARGGAYFKSTIPTAQRLLNSNLL